MIELVRIDPLADVMLFIVSLSAMACAGTGNPHGEYNDRDKSNRNNRDDRVLVRGFDRRRRRLRRPSYSVLVPGRKSE